MINIDYRDSRPIYEQVKDGLRKLIISGAIVENDKLPSVRELAASLAINPNTIQRAYKELEAEGYIYSAAGKGSFAASREETLPIRRGELWSALDTAVLALRETEVSTGEIIEHIKGGVSDDTGKRPR